MRLTTKPGSSWLSTTCLPIALPNAVARAVVCALVARPGITSTSCITGTGLKKCRPMKRAGSGAPRAMRVMGMEEVLVARIASAPRCAPTLSKIFSLMSSRSVAASITTSAASSRARSAIGVIRSTIAPASPAEIFSLATSRSSDAPIAALPFSARSSAMSESSTSYPACAALCAMPRPICPAPITAIVCMRKALSCRRHRPGWLRAPIARRRRDGH